MNENKINIQTDKDFKNQVIKLKRLIFSYISTNKITQENLLEIKTIMIAIGEYIQSFEDQNEKEKKH